MIVLNGEPFVRYNLRALYPFAHQIIVVEGAAPAARGIATEDGHSRDGTLEVLRRFSREEDTERKLVVVTAEDEGKPDGFWSEKDEMSEAYARRATGDYLWQVDSDEFYLPGDMGKVFDMLKEDPGITAVSFRMLTFWGGLGYRVDSLFLRGEMRDIHRLFAWGGGYRYKNHRPPTVVDRMGRNLQEIRPVSAARMASRGVNLYHYELLFPKQVVEKCDYYRVAEWTGGQFSEMNEWVAEAYLTIQRPYRVHMVYKYPSWLERFAGEHPPEVVAMVNAVREGLHPGISLRPTEDVEALLSRPGYAAGRTALKAVAAIRRLRGEVKNQRRRLKRRFRKFFSPRGETASSKYQPASAVAATGDLAKAWQDPAIPAAQRRLVDSELSAMYRGKVVAPFRVLADAVRRTGCERGSLVEVGCASGYYREVLQHLLGHEVQYAGIDYSRSLVGEARRHYPGVPFAVGDATALPLRDGACDVLISGCVILHVPDFRKVISESARAARKWVIFHRTPVVRGPTRRYTKYAYGVRCLEIFFGEEELQALFREFGLNPVAALEISRGTLPECSAPYCTETYICRK
jgi:SAM-dependent methyltransferase